MSMARSHDELKVMVAPYVLGAVPEAEVSEVRAHILTCDECMAEADSLQAVIDDLALAVKAEPLPDGFADRVMGRIEERPAVARRTSRWNLLSQAVALGAAALVFAVAVLTAALVDTRGELSGNRRLIAALWRAEGGMRLEGHSEAIGKIVPAEDGGVIFVARSLEPLADDRDYQLWLMQGSCGQVANEACRKVSAGTFEAKDGAAVLRIRRPPHGFVRSAVTVEPEGGSDQPTTAPVLISLT